MIEPHHIPELISSLDLSKADIIASFENWKNALEDEELSDRKKLEIVKKSKKLACELDNLVYEGLLIASRERYIQRIERLIDHYEETLHCLQEELSTLQEVLIMVRTETV